MHYVRESYVYYLWSVLLSLYDRSALCHALTAAGHWCKRQIADSKAAAVLSREGLLTQSWESSRLCRYLTYLANSPIYLLRIVYQKLKSLFDGSFFAGLIFQMGQETAIAQSWLILLLWIIPYEYWSNGYTLAGFFLLLCLFCVRGMHDRRAKLDIPSMGVFTTVFFLRVCLAAPLSVYPSLSGRFLMYHAGAGLCLLLTISAVRHVDDLKRLAAGGCCAMAISSAYAVYQRIQGVDVKSAYVDAALNPDMPGRVYSFYDNPNSYAAFLILLIPLGAALLLCAKNWISRVLAGGAVALGVLAMVMTYSRASWVGFAVSAAVFVLLWRPRLIPLLAAACVMCIPFLPSSIWDRILSIFNFSDTSTSSRFGLYEAALRAIQELPVTGVGLGTAAPQRYIAANSLYHGNHLYVHAHNIYLEVWLETGLIGVAAFCGAVIWNIKAAVRQVRSCVESTAGLITAGAVSALCGIMTAGLADYPWNYPRVMTVFWFVFAMSVAGVKVCRSEQKD